MNGICHINLARGFRGGERQTELLVRELAGRGLAQRLIARAGQPLARRLRGLPGLEIHEVGKPFWWHHRLGRGRLLHAHDAKAAKLAWLCHRLHGSPYVLTRRVSHRPGNNPLTRAVYRDAGVVVAVAHAVARGLADYQPGVDLRVIHSAVGNLDSDVAQARAIRDRWPGRFLVVNAAALVQSQKGQLHLIRVARRLAAEGSDMQFILLGDGRDRAVMEAAAAGLDNVYFAGFVDNVGDYLAAADAFVLPSLHEGIGGACLDAMDFGLPVVASAVDGVPDIVREGVNGLLVPPADEAALHQALVTLHGDAELRRRLADGGRERARDFRPEVMAQRYLAVYRELAGSEGLEGE